ncbi:MAG: T9SS type A sorting domain-containing protein [bacterium]
MRKFIVISVMLFMVLLLSGQAISDLFESDLGKWRVTENVGINDQSIPNDLNIKINIFDITGRVVDEVYNGIQTKGQHTYKLKNKTTGLYFAVMETEGQTYKAKIINIR